MTARIAGALWLTAGLVYVVCETVTARRLPGYSCVRDYISNLGVPGESPSAGLMNVGAFILYGLLFATAAVLLALSRGRGPRSVVVATLGVTNGVGNVLVGSFHAGESSVHGLGAFLAIVGGNAAIVAAAGLLREIPTSAHASRVLGVLGIMCAAVSLAIASHHTGVEGAVERGAVYPIILWSIVVGGTLLGSRRPRQSVCG